MFNAATEEILALDEVLERVAMGAPLALSDLPGISREFANRLGILQQKGLIDHIGVGYVLTAQGQMVIDGLSVLDLR